MSSGVGLEINENDKLKNNLTIALRPLYLTQEQHINSDLSVLKPFQKPPYKYHIQP